MSNAFAVSVSQVNRFVSLIIKKEEKLSDIYVKGEISNFIYHKSGHMYFTLKDENSALKAVMFKDNVSTLKFIPENGLSVIVRGAIQVYEAGGQYQLYCTEIEPAGIGELYLAYEKLKEKLLKEGLFEQKRQLPKMPMSICIITAQTGAALQDMLNIIGRRFPIASIKLIPSLVQGVNAPTSLVNAIKLAQESECEIIIIGRGGGSYEDLWAFNDEKVARVLYESRIPTISAVGHETDFVITDFVADMRAPTPSAAAELCVPDKNEVLDYLDRLYSGMKNLINISIYKRLNIIENLERIIGSNSPYKKLENAEKRISEISSAVDFSISSALKFNDNKINSIFEIISALSPLNVLKKGYSIVVDNKGFPLKNINSVEEGNDIIVRMNDGRINAKVTGVTKVQKEVENEL
ncbi:MAG: exodeoxyribonuclease VII large subunit [Clostridiales bacterium]|nr:exodeoxyribonuclease VII large subunit [Clostridiales bacterium]